MIVLPSGRSASPTVGLVVAAVSDLDDARRLAGATVGERSLIRLDLPEGGQPVRRVSLYLDDPTSTTPALRRAKAPYALGRGSKRGRDALTVGPHRVVGVVEYRDGTSATYKASYTVRRLAIAPSGDDGAPCTTDRPCRSLQRAYNAALPGEVVEAGEGSYDCGRIRGSRSSLVVVRAADGVTATVDCGLDVAASWLRLERIVVLGRIAFLTDASNASFSSGAAEAFAIYGADDVTIEDSSFDGQSRISNNQIWDDPAGDTPDRFRIVHNTIRNFYGPSPEDHSEGIYVGYSTGGLIERNRFEANGNTAHLFFTWFGNQADPATSYPRDMCVRKNVFGPTRGAFHAISFRNEIPATANIVVTRDNSALGGLGLTSGPPPVAACP